MYIIDKSVPGIDTENLEDSLQGFRNYMAETLELIDFILSNQKNRISGAVSEENFRQLEAQVLSIGSGLANLTAIVYGLSGNLTELEGRVSSLETNVSEIQKDIVRIDEALDSLDKRVTALGG